MLSELHTTNRSSSLARHIFDPDAWSVFWGNSDPSVPGSAAGINLGVSACVGWYPGGDVEGVATGWDVNAASVSPTFYYSPDGNFQGVTLGGGPGIGISESTAETNSWTFWEIWESIW